ncbi:dihydrofolate reductase family protein [Cohnella luojiensis]|uniref:Dihydrofolate reductase n=1 Tax=Cohnella luojiensis TaxID=652876 RepID=A0A4Y8LZA5_9BACL|nr:dihydrofolate reductase family protein [Cohnella luojiensis]TFE24734.1 dihydrofolate reductase [Cohnella luojiensis]
MGKVILDITMSLDGFIAGPNISSKLPLGEGGLRLHDWIFGAKTDKDDMILQELTETSGAVILGRRTYDDAIEDAWGGVSPFHVPAFVVSGEEPEEAIGDSSFIFVTDGIESTIRQAQAVAGDKNVWVMGGANLAQQYIEAGLLDEMQIHVAPVLLCKGTPLFKYIGIDLIELESTRVLETPGAIHLRYRIVKP